MIVSWQKEHQFKKRPRVLAKQRSAWQRSTLGKARSKDYFLVQKPGEFFSPYF